MKSAGEKKTNTPLSVEGDKQVAIMIIIVIINKVLLFFQIDHNLSPYTNLGISNFSNCSCPSYKFPLYHIFYIPQLVSSRFMQAPAWKYDLSVPNPCPLFSIN